MNVCNRRSARYVAFGCRLDGAARGVRHQRALATIVTLGIIAVLLPHWAKAQSVGPASNVTPQSLPEIVVTGTRIPEPVFNVPASITVVKIGGLETDTLGINTSEYLRQIPGVVARNRQNYAQDEQISIRGFGSRSTFGVRGVRLYTDGIPATMPDGQGQVSNFDLGGADRIEVLRGPFSVLYGNSSGGVIQIFSADGSQPAELLGNFGVGSYGTWRLDMGARGARGDFGYNLDLSKFHTDGFRRHSYAERINSNAKLDLTVGHGGKLTLLANTVSLPQALDPQGLTREQFDQDPRQAAPSATAFNTRKSVHQAQGGLVYTQELDDQQSLRALVYYGHRTVQQFLSVPMGAQQSPLSSGGVVDLDTFYGGGDFRWTWRGALADRPLNFTAGVNYDRAKQGRRGYENFDGDSLGVIGALRRNEQDDVYNVDEYAQGSWDFAPHWSLILGIRHSVVRFASSDYFITATNPDDSGRVAYGSTNPVAGVMFDASDDWHLYASYGNGFETPTFSEIGYRPNGETSLNFDLVPARSKNGEVGSKWRFTNGGRVDVALFQNNSQNEIAVLSSSGGRTTYQNVGNSRRRGGEIGMHLPLGAKWQLDAAYTYLDATFQDAFGNCSAPGGCIVQAGAPLPGVPRNLVNVALRWGGNIGWQAALVANAASTVTANDAGLLVAPGYAILGLSAGYTVNTAHYEVAPYARLDNLFNHSYVGSVIVNQVNGSAFEPAPGRTFWLGIKIKFLHDD